MGVYKTEGVEKKGVENLTAQQGCWAVEPFQQTVALLEAILVFWTLKSLLHTSEVLPLQRENNTIPRFPDSWILNLESYFYLLETHGAGKGIPLS